MAAIFGVCGALLCGIDMKDVMNYYVLPIMGGGNGAGAIPLSQMWETTTGGSKGAYYSVAFAILNIANNFAILGAVALNSLGERFPSLSGNGELLRNASKYELPKDKAAKPEISQYHMGGGLLLTCCIFAAGRIFSKSILPSIGKVSIHMYAYMVVFSAVLNIANVIPQEVKLGAKRPVCRSIRSRICPSAPRWRRAPCPT
ncbi:hypothetical protein FYJ74_07235 [Pyramidobacter sp. SM-530-WT-4B]|uniref:Uncharacterized protein n=1 Tax=Pyramidobacter porci TaxID=2605789 RepID=A0A6L5YE28_9BACT|nr:2-hydroxycarboxylate transporter family protein [Pyramidobacter porci]MST55822.1 hypothetical protein [Pyramidobacter porci]